MLKTKRLIRVGAVAAVSIMCALGSQLPVRATTVSDRGAAILIWPKVVVDTTNSTDTLLQMANLSAGTCTGGVRNGEACINVTDCPGPGSTGCSLPTNVVATHCFYVNANRHCDNTGDVCTSGSDCVVGDVTGGCVDGWSEVNFDIFITPNQPLSWSASSGLAGSDLPCQPAPNNRCSISVGMSSVTVTNAGTRIPPAPEDPFIGELKCIEVDSNSRLPAQCNPGACRNDLIGHATVESINQNDSPDPEKYNAIGLVALQNNADGDLVIGGGGGIAEYDACPGVLVLNHLFDGATDPISDSHVASTELTLVPCSEDLSSGILAPTTAQFLVYNEFEQRFSASRQVRCLLDTVISRIDTTQSSRSIFSAGVSGTVAGQTRITGVNGGLVGAALVSFSGESPTSGAGYNLNQQTDRDTSDTIRIP